MSAEAKKSKTLGESYSEIISPESYNLLMTDQHLYIKAADRYIAKIISEKIERIESPEIIEIGCGPARITPMVYEKNKKGRFYGLDVDETFIQYAINKYKELPIKFIVYSVLNYKHSKLADIFYSEGFHHHIAKDYNLDIYLKNIFSQLKSGGYYIVGDEFIANYDNAYDREINLVLWYCHIIGHAIKDEYYFLAQEEAKTLLDDIYEGRENKNIKTQGQIDLVLALAPEINRLSKQKNLSQAKQKGKEFLEKLKNIYNKDVCNDNKMDLSRGDFKISPAEFVREVESIGFVVEEYKEFGPPCDIGEMGVFTLRKP